MALDKTSATLSSFPWITSTQLFGRIRDGPLPHDRRGRHALPDGRGDRPVLAARREGPAIVQGRPTCPLPRERRQGLGRRAAHQGGGMNSEKPAPATGAGPFENSGAAKLPTLHSQSTANGDISATPTPGGPTTEPYGSSTVKRQR